MPPSYSLLRRQPGKTLWSMALMVWLSVSPAQAEDNAWIDDVAHAHIAEHHAWPPSDYHLRIRYEKDGVVALYVHHRDDDAMGRQNSQGSWIAGGGKSFEIYLDEKTRSVVKEVWFQ